MGPMIETHESRLHELKRHWPGISRFVKFLEVIVVAIVIFGSATGVYFVSTYYIPPGASLIFSFIVVLISSFMIGFFTPLLAHYFFAKSYVNEASILKIREKEQILYQRIQFHVNDILNKKSTGKEIPYSS